MREKRGLAGWACMDKKKPEHPITFLAASEIRVTGRKNNEIVLTYHGFSELR
jgi:hypothetical protein